MSDKSFDDGLLLKPFELDRETLLGLIRATEAGSARLVDWQIYGRPAIDGLVAKVVVPVAEAGGLVQNIAALPSLRPRLGGFVYGIPRIDTLQLTIAAGRTGEAG